MELLMPYTREEECWLQDQFRLLDEAYCSVTPSDAFVQKYIGFAQGIPVPPGSPVHSLVLLRERVWRILNIHPEFRSLSSQVQSGYMDTNGTCGILLLSVHVELASSGLEQLRVTDPRFVVIGT
jgi:hypothetical protein